MGGNYFRFTESNLRLLESQLNKLDFIFWDTGFIKMILDDRDNVPTVASCHALFENYLRDKLLNVTCDFVIEEIINVLIRLHYQAELDALANSTYKSWTALYKAHPEYIQKYYPNIIPVFDLIEQTPLLVHRTSNDIYQEAKKFIKTFNLCSMDAYILASMIDAGIEDIITVDVTDFKRVKDANIVNIYSCYDEPFA